MYPSDLMERLIKYSLIIAGLYTVMRTVIHLFFYDQLPVAFLATNFNQEQMSEYRARVILPAFFLTLIYFIYRHFSGKNPTSPLWPIYVISISFAITQIIGFITFLPFTRDTITMFFITLFMCLIVRAGHNKRKNEIF